MHITYISNISYSVTRRIIYELFIQVTPIKRVSYKSKIALVEYFNKNDQKKSFEMLNNIQLYSRRIIMSIKKNTTVINLMQ